MRRPLPHQLGVSLVELLVALAVFGIVMAIAFGAINGSLRIQSDQEAVTTTQGKLRRIVEVVSQDLRSAVFGSITNTPYDSDRNQVSFMMLTGGAGYTVLPPPSLNDFPVERRIHVQMADASHLVGSEVVMIESTEGVGVVLPITRVNSVSGRPGTWELHSTCRNTIRFQQNSTLIFEIETTGLRYDSASQSIRITSAGNDEAAFAFGISDFRIDYVYRSGNDLLTRNSPVESGGAPQRTMEQGGRAYTLERVQFVIAAEAESRGRSNEHVYTGQVDLSSNEHFTVEEVVPCD